MFGFFFNKRKSEILFQVDREWYPRGFQSHYQVSPPVWYSSVWLGGQWTGGQALVCLSSKGKHGSPLHAVPVSVCKSKLQDMVCCRRGLCLRKLGSSVISVAFLPGAAAQLVVFA